MKKIHHKNLPDILGNSRQLQGLLAKSHRLEKLNNAVLALLTEDLQQHCYVANIRENQLIIAAESAAWVTSIRYQSGELLEALRGIEPDIANIKIVVQPKMMTEIPHEKTVDRDLSADTAEQLRICAAGIKDDKLRQVLQNLANHSQQE